MVTISNEDNGFSKNVNHYLDKLKNSFTKKNIEKINFLANDLFKVWVKKRNVYICGNGGSAANSIHLANDLIFGAGACGNKPIIDGLRVEALSSNSAVISCIANDINYEEIFSTQIKTKGKKGDLLIVLSGSGNSKNIINAINMAKEKGVKTYAIVGYDGGICKEISDETIHFNVDDMQISEDCQLIVGHLCMQYLNTHKPL